MTDTDTDTDTDTTDMTDTTDPTTPVANACDAGPSQACVDARQAELDAIKDNSETTLGELDAAETALEDATNALDDANTAMMEETTVSGLINTAMTAVGGITFVADGDDNSTPAEVKAAEDAVLAAQVSLAGMENLSDDTKTDLQDRITALSESLAPNATAVRMAAVTAAADTKRKRIEAEAVQPMDAGLGGSVAPITTEGSEGEYTQVIKRDRMATTVTITVEGATKDDDEMFALNDMGMHVRTHEADADGNVMTEVARVVTDIEAPRAVAFAKWLAGPGDDTAPQMLNRDSSTGAAAVSPAVNNALEIPVDAVDADLTGDPNPNLMFARSTMDGVLNYTRDNPVAGEPATAGVDEGLHDGTYNGAEGTYRCTAATGSCSVTFNAKGQVVGNSENWVFVPDKGATSEQPDYDYLHYGFWLKRTTDEDGNVEYNEVETFAGSEIDQTDAVTGVAGSASYEGGAVGVYVNDVLNPNGTTANSTSGHFKADAELAATFGQVQDDSGDVAAGTIAANMLNTITGTIDNFELSGGESNTWSVALSGNIEATAVGFSGTAKGGVGEGSFSGMFHGAAASDDEATLEENDSVYPHSATGEFNAGFTNGSVAGAFGVREVKE